MDENLINFDQNPSTTASPEKEQKESMEKNAENIRKFSMDDSGRIRREDIRTGMNGAAAFTSNSKIFIVLGWISAALTAFIHPLFAVVGIIFGILVNKKAIGRGNAIIISNIVLAAINIVLGLLLIAVI